MVIIDRERRINGLSKTVKLSRQSYVFDYGKDNVKIISAYDKYSGKYCYRLLCFDHNPVKTMSGYRIIRNLILNEFIKAVE